MRLLLSTALAAALALPFAGAPLTAAVAQTTTDPAAPPATAEPAAPAAPAMPQGMSMAPAAGAKTKTAHKRQTLQQRFDAANTSHDGHLTQAQAAAAKWNYVNKRFSGMDKDHKGYVTVDDIRGYSHATKAAHHMTPKPAAPAATTTN